MASQSFSGKTVVVVSIASIGAGGLGPASSRDNLHLGAVCAREFARRGAHVVAVDGNRQALDLLVSGIEATGGKATALQADPCDAEDLVRAAAGWNDGARVVHALVNCHSEPKLCTIEDSSAETWTRAVAGNLLGPVFASKAFLPLLRKADGASIVHLGSIDGTLGNPRIPAYSAAKGGLVPLTHVMADEFASYNIRVNCVARGMTAARDAPPHPPFAALVVQTPLGRPGYPEEVAAAVCFLASDEASYISGVVLPVDGGRTGITQGTRR